MCKCVYLFNQTLFLDVNNSKHFPRSRRREQSSCSNNVKFDQGRKPNLQKNKNLDKRPRPRGQYYYGGKEDTQVNKNICIIVFEIKKVVFHFIIRISALLSVLNYYDSK